MGKNLQKKNDLDTAVNHSTIHQCAINVPTILTSAPLKTINKHVNRET